MNGVEQEPGPIWWLCNTMSARQLILEALVDAVDAKLLWRGWKLLRGCWSHLGTQLDLGLSAMTKSGDIRNGSIFV